MCTSCMAGSEAAPVISLAKLLSSPAQQAARVLLVLWVLACWGCTAECGIC